MSFHLQLEGRRALVTAGTKGVGGAVVRALAEAGVVVAATARHLPEKGLEGVHYIAADLARAVGCAAAVTPSRNASVASTSSSMCSAVPRPPPAASPLSAMRSGVVSSTSCQRCGSTGRCFLACWPRVPA